MGKSLKWIVIAIVLAVAANVIKESLKADKEVDARIALKASCARQAKAGEAVPAEHIETVCACATDSTAKALGPDKFLRLATVKDATDADKEALLGALAACIEEHVPES